MEKGYKKQELFIPIMGTKLEIVLSEEKVSSYVHNILSDNPDNIDHKKRWREKELHFEMSMKMYHEYFK